MSRHIKVCHDMSHHITVCHDMSHHITLFINRVGRTLAHWDRENFGSSGHKSVKNQNQIPFKKPYKK
jgi:hypothetical protein